MDSLAPSDYILNEAPARFRRRDVERALHGISLATIRLVLTELRDVGQIKAEGSGAGAHWARVHQSASCSSDHR